jgi:CheY-like chemotaxis protein
VRNFTRHVLEGSGYTVIESVDGEDAVAKFEKNKDRVNLLLLDVIMPKKKRQRGFGDGKKNEA